VKRDVLHHLSVPHSASGTCEIPAPAYSFETRGVRPEHGRQPWARGPASPV